MCDLIKLSLHHEDLKSHELKNITLVFNFPTAVFSVPMDMITYLIFQLT